MPRPFTTSLPVLAVSLSLLAPLLSGKAVAGPPERVSGRMVFVDSVSDFLRLYRAEEDREKRIQWLERFAEIEDVRLAVALGEAMDEADPLLRLMAARRLSPYGAPPIIAIPRVRFDFRQIDRVQRWWKEHEADLRRRAKQLPQ